MVEDMSQPWDFENKGKYWLKTSETTGVFCTNWKGVSKQKGKKQGLGLSIWGEKVYKKVDYQLGFVSFSYGYDGVYLLEAAVEVRWTSGEPLQKACFVGLEWDEVEGHLDNYYPSQEEKTTTVSHSASRFVCFFFLFFFLMFPCFLRVNILLLSLFFDLFFAFQVVQCDRRDSSNCWRANRWIRNGNVEGSSFIFFSVVLKNF